jgi:adenosylhomocysteinase
MKDHGRGLSHTVHEVPKAIDEAVSRLKLAGVGMAVDTLTPEQEAYLSGWEV